MFELSVRCPHCHESLLDHDLIIDEEPSILLRLRQDQTDGWLRLSSVYGSDHYESNLDIANEEVVSFLCPACDHSLASAKECRACGATVARLDLTEGGSVKLCTRKGCKRNTISFADPRALAIQKLVPRDYPSIPSHAAVSEAAQLMIREGLPVIPVVQGSSFEFNGLLPLAHIMALLFAEGRDEIKQRAVEELDLRQCPLVPTGTPLEVAARQAVEQNASHIAVHHGNRLIGLVVAESIYRILLDFGLSANGHEPPAAS